jgi:hypothetical protein
MKRSSKIIALSLAAMFAGGASALAEEVSTTTNTTSDTMILDPATDQTGAAIFGFDISHAGNTPDAVQQFLAGLSPDQQQSVQTGCVDVLKDAAVQQNSTVVMFCHNVLS